MSFSAAADLAKLNATLMKVVDGGREFCSNANCNNKTKKLQNASRYAYYFGAKLSEGKQVWKICPKCFQKAEEFERKAKTILRDGGNLFSLTFENPASQNQDSVIVNIDDDDEKEPQIPLVKGQGTTTDAGTNEDSDDAIYSVSVEVLDKEVAEIMDKFCIREQLSKYKTFVETEVNELGAEFKSLEHTMKKAYIQLSETYSKCKLLLEPVGGRKRELDTVDTDCLGYSSNIKCKQRYVNKSSETETGPTPHLSQLTTGSVNLNPSLLHLNAAINQRRKLTIEHTGGIGINSGRRRPICFHPPKVNKHVYVMYVDLLTSWLPAVITKVVQDDVVTSYELKLKCESGPGYFNRIRTVLGNEIAFMKPILYLNLPVGTRVIAKFKDLFNKEPATDGKFFAGIVAEVNELKNKNRYLIFFDDGFSQYIPPVHVLPVVKPSNDVLDDIHKEARPFIRYYLSNFPNVRLLSVKPGDHCTVNHCGKWLRTKVEEVDCSLMKIVYIGNKARSEWIYRGSLRLMHLQKKEVHLSSRHLSGPKTDDITVKEDIGSTQSANRSKTKCGSAEQLVGNVVELMCYETAGSMTKINIPLECPVPNKFVPHICTSFCVPMYQEEAFRKVPALVIPFHLGWARKITGPESASYISPCGIELKTYELIQLYLIKTQCGIPIDFFALERSTDCLNTFKVARKISVLKDISYGKEWVPIECVNSINHDLPEHMDYVPNRIFSKEVNVILEDGFLSCCDCSDNCNDKYKCACWKLTLASQALQDSEDESEGYVNRRLPKFVRGGIYECNKMCKCNVQACSNRVAQNKPKWPLQVFKTIKKGWGVRTLCDIPKGAYICHYSGQVLSHKEADIKGEKYGDECIADLDFIDSVEKIKEGYESCIVASDDDEKDNAMTEVIYKKEAETSASANSKDRDGANRKCLARKSSKGKTETQGSHSARKAPVDVNCIISRNDRDAGGPLLYRKYFGCNGKAEKLYCVDGKHKGNIGRYFNHSCDPNLFTQNVFIDTHDLRFPIIAFFTCKSIKAGTELCWDYNYVVGSVPGKILLCYCNSANCSERLL